MSAFEGATQSGLAGEILRATESEQFDLAGVTGPQATQLVQDVFAQEWSRSRLPKLPRISLVVGAGKLGRQKYPAELQKALVSSLRDVGFEEDSGASCMWECGGSYKTQHDTGRNLKLLHVFPKVTAEGGEDADGAEGVGAEPQWSREELLAVCGADEFRELLGTKLATWKQRKQLQQKMSGVMQRIRALEQQMCTGAALSSEDQRFYDAVSAEELEEKGRLLQAELKAMVEEGRLTASDRAAALEAATSRLRELQAEAGAAGGGAKVRKQLENISARVALLEEAQPVDAPVLHEARIAEIWQQMEVLEPLARKEQSSSLSLQEVRQLAELEPMQAELGVLLDESRGWYEEDADFDDRMRGCWNRFQEAQKKKRAAAARRARAKKGSGWASASSRKGAASRRVRKPTATKGVASSFAALGLSDDSDSD